MARHAGGADRIDGGRALDVPTAMGDPARTDGDVLAQFIAASEVCSAACSPALLEFELDVRPTLVVDGAWLLPEFVAALELPDRGA